MDAIHSRDRPPTHSHVFVLGADYHLGDLLWFTAVVRRYRQITGATHIVVVHPNAALSHVLEHNPDIDDVRDTIPPLRRSDVVRDLRPVPIGRAMVRDWRYHLPWLYYRDLWCQARGQWLATYLRLGTLENYRPVLELREEDYAIADTLPQPYVALAPHTGSYQLAPLTRLWRRVKGWPGGNWSSLAQCLARQGVTPLTLAAAKQDAIPGTVPLLGLPIRQVGGIIDRAQALVSGESGLWFIAAALCTPFVIVPWWLPRSIDWTEPMNVPHRLVHRDEATVERVVAALRGLGV